MRSEFARWLDSRGARSDEPSLVVELFLGPRSVGRSVRVGVSWVVAIAFLIFGYVHP